MATTLNLNYDPKPAENGFRRVAASMKDTEKAANSLGNRAVMSAKSLSGMGQASQQAGGSAEFLNSAIARTVPALGGFGEELSKMMPNLSRLAPLLARVGVAGGALYATISSLSTIYKSLAKDTADVDHAHTDFIRTLEKLRIVKSGVGDYLDAEAAAIARTARLRVTGYRAEDAGERADIRAGGGLTSQQSGINAKRVGAATANSEAAAIASIASLKTVEKNERDIYEWERKIHAFRDMSNDELALSERRLGLLAKQREVIVQREKQQISDLRTAQIKMIDDRLDKEVKAHEERMKFIDAEKQARMKAFADIRAEELRGIAADRNAKAGDAKDLMAGPAGEVLAGLDPDKVRRLAKKNRRGERDDKLSDANERINARANRELEGLDPDDAINWKDNARARRRILGGAARERSESTRSIRKEFAGGPSGADTAQAQGQLAQAVIQEAGNQGGFNGEMVSGLGDALKAIQQKSTEDARRDQEIAKIRAMLQPHTRAKAQRTGRN